MSHYLVSGGAGFIRASVVAVVRAASNAGHFLATFSAGGRRRRPSSSPSRRVIRRTVQVLGTLVLVGAIANCGDGSSPAPAATQLIFTTQPSSAVAGGPLGTVEVHALDADGKGADFNDDVTIGIQPGSGTPGATVSGIARVKASKGVATFTTLAIQTAGTGYALVATAPGLTPTVPSTPFDITAGAAHHLGVTTQPSGATNGQHFGTQPLVQVQDQYNNAVALQGVLVTAAIATGGGVLTGNTVATTDVNGVATFTDLVITGTAGAHTLSFAATNFTSAALSSSFTLGAGAATHLAIATQPSATAGSGAVFVQQPVIQLRDASENVVPTGGTMISVAIASGGGTLGGTTSVSTGTDGVANFLDLALSGTVGNRTLVFTASGLTAASSGTIALGAGAPHHLTITTQPSTSAANGAAFLQQPVVEVRDAAGNLVTTSTAGVTAAISQGGGTLSGAMQVNAAGGIASFTGLAITGTIGARTLSFTSGALGPATSNNITLTAGAADHLALATQPSGTVGSGTAFTQQPVVQLRDVSDNPVPTAGVAVTATIASGGGTLGGTATVNTNSSGNATFTNLSISGSVGIRTLTFGAGALAPATSGNVNVSSGPAAKLAITTLPSTTAASGEAFAQQPAIEVQDASGNAVPAAGTVVTAAIASGGGTLLGTATASTNASGVASFTDLGIAGLVGTKTLRFSATGLTVATSGNIDITVGAAASLIVTTQPSATVANGATLVQQPTVQVADAGGNPVSQAGVVVTATIGSGGGALGGTATATTGGNGAATFINLSITGTTGQRTLAFSGGSFTPATSNSINVTAGALDHLTITTQPSATVASGAVLAQQPVIQLRDVSDNLVTSNGVAITAAIATGGGTLGGTINPTTVGGIATFTNLSISGTIGNRTLNFTSGALPPVTSATINLTAGTPTQLAITTQPSTTAAVAAAFALQPAIQLRDGGGNAVSQGNLVITAAIASGGGTLGGTATASTNGSGLATFANLSITGAIGARTLTFTSPNLTAATSTSISITVGPAAQLAITTQPSAAATNAAAFTQQPVLQLRDAGGNAVSQSGVGVTAAIASGGGTLGGAATVNTNTSGVATFAGLAITGTVGNRTLGFTSTGLTAATSSAINLTAGAATTMAIVAGTNNQSTSVGTAVPLDPSVLVTDVSGNPVSGRNVTFTVATGGGTLSPASPATIATNASGLATVTSWTMGAVAGSNTLTVTSATPAPALTPVTFTATGTAVISGSMWIANFDAPSVGIYPVGASGNATPTATIEGANTGFSQPDGVARDAAGNLYVCDFMLSRVAVFASGATGNASPIRVIQGGGTGLSGPVGMAFDSQGNLYVSNETGGGGTGSVTVYSPGANGNATPIRTLVGPGGAPVDNPSGLAISPGDTLYVINQGNKIQTFAPGANGTDAPLRTIAGPTTQMNEPEGIALDASQNIWTVNIVSNSLIRFDHGADGDVAPAVVISGSNTGLAGAIGLARAGNELYVANYNNGTGNVLVFSTASTGNASPTRTLTGGLVGPFWITF
jgi:sugar lactone lactonase YvrE